MGGIAAIAPVAYVYGARLAMNRRMHFSLREKRAYGAHASDWFMAGPTGLEPATSTVTVWRSSQLSYDPLPMFERLFRWVKSRHLVTPVHSQRK